MLGVLVCGCWERWASQWALEWYYGKVVLAEWELEGGGGVGRVPEWDRTSGCEGEFESN